MGAIGTLSPGYDPGYLLRESSKGLDSGYYLSAVDSIGEPPGVWTGRGGAELGLMPGAEVEPVVMERVYGKLLDPRDPAFVDNDTDDKDKAILGNAPRTYKTKDQILADLLAKEPDAGPERQKILEIEAAKKVRHNVIFLDYTFSADKSVSVLHAGLQLAAVRAERAGDAAAAAEFRRQADVVEFAVRAGAQAALDYAQAHAGYSRAGRHGSLPKDAAGRPVTDRATGRFVDAHDWIIASFLQHTSRDNDVQLHVHNAILNRVQTADGQWLTLDSRALHRLLPAMNAVGARVMDETIARELGAEFAARADGKTREIRAVPQPVKDLFSSRRAVITKKVAELAEAYEAKHKHPPSARALWSMAQYATLRTRHGKSATAPTRQQLLEGWAAKATAAEVDALDGIPAMVLGTQDPGAPGLEAVAGKDLEEMLDAAVAAVQERHSSWTRPQLLAKIDAQLPAWLGGLPAHRIGTLLDELTDQALARVGVVDQEAPDLVPAPESLRRRDGKSVYAPHDRALYTTRPHQDAEEKLIAAGGQSGGPAGDPDRAAAALAATTAELAAVPGRILPHSAGAERPDGPTEQDGRRYAGGLRADQAAAVHGIVTSGRPVDLLIGPAGAGKSHTMSGLASVWASTVGGRVIGVATAEAAAQVLADDGLRESRNIARFLAMHARGEIRLAAGDLLVVDEASMVGTAELTALHAITTAAGAKMLLVGDPAQLPSITAGGAFGLIAEQHGWYELTRVERMTEEWEREASLRLRAGDTGVIADYDRRGRLTEGTAENMGEAAYRGWLADHLRGRDSLIITATNEQAASLSARARAALVDVGLVDEAAPLLLADGNRAGNGDLVQARRNDRMLLDADGRQVINRDVWRIDRCRDRDAVVRRYLGRDRATGDRRWSAPFTVPASYLAGAAHLGYASTVHSAQGRTVDTAHALISAGLSRASAYVALTRGRLANYGYAIAEPGPGQDPDRTLADQSPGRQRAADLQPGARTAPQLATPARDAPRSVRDRARGTDPGATTPWAPEADRYSILAAALEAGDPPVTATGTRRDELLRQGHMAHLGAIWVSEVAAEHARRCDRILEDLLPPGLYERYLAEDARAELHRQVRAATLAGHDPGQVLASAVGAGALEGNAHRRDADDVSKVLHWRIARMIGDPPPLPASRADRTPAISDDPELQEYLQALARLLDARQAELGRAAAAQPPPWAGRLGPVPSGQEGKEEWIRRAGAVAAYREEYGYAEERPIGREPAAPEARASWRAAAVALGADPEQLDLARRSDGDLHAARACYRRELAWAPAHVDDDLRTTAIARREHETEAVIAQAAADGPGGPIKRQAAADRARRHQRFAAILARRKERLTAVSQDRARWYEQTSEIRKDALAATAELRRRGVDVAPLEEPQGQETRETQAEDASRPDGAPDWERAAGQAEAASMAAEHAARDLAGRNRARSSRQERRRSRRHEHERPRRSRGPHRDGPGMSR